MSRRRPVTRFAEATLTPDEAMQLAISHHRLGELDLAEAIYEALLQREPHRPDALNFMGMLQFQRGHAQRARELLQRAAVVAPMEPGVWNNLGTVLLSLGRTVEAGKAFRRSLALQPSAEAHTNLARVHHRRREWARGEAACRRALALAPEFGQAWHYLSLVLLGLGRAAEAFDAAVQAELHMPAAAGRRETYGLALSAAGLHERAVAFYRDWLDKEPGNPYVRHHLAASLGESPERASEAYVEQVFDRFAATFDVQLANLEYCAPELVAAALRKAWPAPAAQFDIADLGCGTGLCGPLLEPWARSLVGCDLSAAMLERAAPRAAYDALVKAELVQFLLDRPGAFDVLVSADTLIYFGELGPVFCAARAALRPGGTLVFTLEASDEACAVGYRLTPSGRYAHALACVRARLAGAGLVEGCIETVSPRIEGARPVAGWLVTATRPA